MPRQLSTRRQQRRHEIRRFRHHEQRNRNVGQTLSTIFREAAFDQYPGVLGNVGGQRVPVRLALQHAGNRVGDVFTSEGPLNIKNAQFSEDDGPVDPACGCYTCRNFSRAYLRHLSMAGEMTGGTLNTLHNLSFYLDSMRRIREAISFGRFEDFRQKFHQTFGRRALIS